MASSVICSNLLQQNSRLTVERNNCLSLELLQSSCVFMAHARPGAHRRV